MIGQLFFDVLGLVGHSRSTGIWSDGGVIILGFVDRFESEGISLVRVVILLSEHIQKGQLIY